MNAKWKWLKDAEKTLKRIDREAKNATKRAVRRAVKPLRTKVREDAPARTGALRKSISSKVDGRKAEDVFAVVGPRSKYEKAGKIPNKYAKKIDALNHFLSGQNLKPYLDLMLGEVQKELSKF